MLEVYEKKIGRSLRERKAQSWPLAVKALDEAGRFAGYASVFEVVDNQRDVVERGAFARTLRERAGEVKLLWQHQQSEPIGVFTEMFEDARGLYVEGQLLLEVARAREAYALLKAGAVTGLSIGYLPLRYRVEPDSGVRRLLEVALYEVSLVTFAANEAAAVTVVKSGGDEMAELAVAVGRARELLEVRF